VLVCGLQDARTIEDKSASKGPAMSKEAQKAQAVAALRREEAALAQQASDIASQVCDALDKLTMLSYALIVFWSC
jgi:cell fate (sporulation/competence/biofilm development) regulator YlbF (YheA/YmcA/DUF963 family)